jgi:uncharacterized protein involved in outer membrane biogenesis
MLNAFDARLEIEVLEVLSRTDNLGSGVLTMGVQDGRLRIDPLRLNVPGGSVRLVFAYHPTETEAAVRLRALIDRFDVGMLVQRVAPGKSLGGQLSLDVDLYGTAPDLKHWLANTSGHIDFAFWPENLAVGIVDLWAVNVITVLAENVDDAPRSILNCMVARFGIENGRMAEEVIFMDTTRMRVRADAEIDFKAKTIDVLAVPEAKRPEYFSLAIPVKIRGAFSDFGVGVNKLSIAKTAITFITSPITVTFKRLFLQAAPADGQAACEAAWVAESPGN